MKRRLGQKWLVTVTPLEDETPPHYTYVWASTPEDALRKVAKLTWPASAQSGESSKEPASPATGPGSDGAAALNADSPKGTTRHTNGTGETITVPAPGVGPTE